MTETVTLSLEEALSICREAARRAGAGPATAEALAGASVDAERDGQPTVGIGHLIDYLESLEAGRIDGTVEPELSRPAGAIILSDAKGGSAHLGFDRAFNDLAQTARLFGVAVFSQKNAFTSGSLSYFVGRLAEAGLVGFAATNGPALLAGSGATKPVYCTNPLAFAAPVEGGAPLVIDQASSATAFVNVRKAAQEGRDIPEGWALDAEGRPTTDAKAAVKGALLAFGGARGANIALMVEVLAAGISGANWSLDAPGFTSGSQSPGSGLFVLALDPKLIDPDFSTRLAAQLHRLSGGYGVHIPGLAKAAAREKAERSGIVISKEIYDRVAGWGRR
ncbi:(2R)-3-sulfolactate dehydrogenase (NADP+) [Mesorhizobium soli]|uniref:Ldh family oxidoreductase n=1 Tax=Pseudaminobacter soli (ex Li et al. 2025) TaxID=1295366 RepID=UPI0024761CA5|nr:Ldh family oxidoreductase [Mesorhizobium soli]MDH6230857.1 (2R)-3-sulfolactate dehydrogenase (NADP+) [Mesorhizobium soli]